MFPEPIAKLLQLWWAVTPILIIIIAHKVRKLQEQTSEVTKQLSEIIDRLHELPEKRSAGVIDTALKAIEEEIKQTNSLLREAAQSKRSGE